MKIVFNCDKTVDVSPEKPDISLHYCQFQKTANN